MATRSSLRIKKKDTTTNLEVIKPIKEVNSEDEFDLSKSVTEALSPPSLKKAKNPRKTASKKNAKTKEATEQQDEKTIKPTKKASKSKEDSHEKEEVVSKPRKTLNKKQASTKKTTKEKTEESGDDNDEEKADDSCTKSDADQVEETSNEENKEKLEEAKLTRKRSIQRSKREVSDKSEEEKDASDQAKDLEEEIIEPELAKKPKIAPSSDSEEELEVKDAIDEPKKDVVDETKEKSPQEKKVARKRSVKNSKKEVVKKQETEQNDEKHAVEPVKVVTEAKAKKSAKKPTKSKKSDDSEEESDAVKDVAVDEAKEKIISDESEEEKPKEIKAVRKRSAKTSKKDVSKMADNDDINQSEEEPEEEMEKPKKGKKAPKKQAKAIISDDSEEEAVKKTNNKRSNKRNAKNKDEKDEITKPLRARTTKKSQNDQEDAEPFIDGVTNKAYQNYMKKRLHSTSNNLKQFNLPNLTLKPKKKKVIPDDNDSSEGNSSESDNWENVNEKSNLDQDEENDQETELMKGMLDNLNKSEKSQDEEIVVEFSRRNQNVKDVDPRVKARLFYIKYMRENQRLIHKLDVMLIMSFGRYINLKCDNGVFRAFALSLFNNFSDPLPTPETLKEIKTVKTILVYINKLTSISKSFNLKEILDFSDGQISPHASVLVFIALMRQLGFDTRLILSFTPNSHQYKATMSEKARKTLNNDKTKKAPSSRKQRKKQIISSSEDDSEDSVNEAEDEEKEPSELLFGLSKNEVDRVPFLISAEVYLPYKNEFLACSPIIDSIHETIPFIQRKKYTYSYAFTSAKIVNGHIPYRDRCPYDVAYIYDNEWATNSQNKRIASEDVDRIVEIHKHIYRRDVYQRTSLIIEDESNEELKKRDLQHRKNRVVELLKQPLPQIVGVYKKHPLYAIEKNLLKHEAMYPLEPIGTLKNGTPVYPREYVRLCHTREIWFREAKTVKIGERPAKLVSARLNFKKKLLQQSTDVQPTSELFGPWQVEEYIPPVAENGIVPKNEFNNVEIYLPKMVPGNCVHLNIDGLAQVCKKNKIDYAPAVVGWQFSCGGWAHPVISGVVVCQENVSNVLKLFTKKLKEDKSRKRQAAQERALKNWRYIIRALLIWSRLNPKQKIIENSEPAPKQESVSENSQKRKETSSSPDIEPVVKKERIESVIAVKNIIPEPVKESSGESAKDRTAASVSSSPAIQQRGKRQSTRRLPIIDDEEDSGSDDEENKIKLDDQESDKLGLSDATTSEDEEEIVKDSANKPVQREEDKGFTDLF